MADGTSTELIRLGIYSALPEPPCPSGMHFYLDPWQIDMSALGPKARDTDTQDTGTKGHRDIGTQGHRKLAVARDTEGLP